MQSVYKGEGHTWFLEMWLFWEGCWENPFGNVHTAAGLSQELPSTLYIVYTHEPVMSILCGVAPLIIAY